uniref:tRNA:m(4)X modification enzyme TRM13 n=1 Tax=Pavo cristatus TaxID=9049 RepID=A0A8C9F766_PAVCR
CTTAGSAPEAGPLPGRCAFFVQRKRRFCKMIPAPGRRFCGEHGQQEVPTVYEDQLQKHLKKCNSREKPKPVSVNSALESEYELQHTLNMSFATYVLQKQKHLKPLLKRSAFVLLSHQALQEALNDPKNGDSAFKHLKQQASILGNMEKLHLLGPGRCFVEFGAGRGKLSHWVDTALQDVENIQFLLVERATTRFKVDGKHKKRDSIFERLQVDIQHLCLNKVPILEKKKLPVVGIGKHLCGAATDLALRCLVESYATCCNEENEEPAPKRTKNKAEGASNSSNGDDNERNKEDFKPVAGIVIALCCHHKCDWTHYVGREFFRSAGLGPVEFHYFQRMSSWATCGMRGTITKASTNEESEDHTNNTEDHDQTYSKTEAGSDALQGLLTVEERKQIGSLCKLVIDHGRIRYLQHRGYKAALQYYTDSSVSLENVLLTAVPETTS